MTQYESVKGLYTKPVKAWYIESQNKQTQAIEN